MDKPGVLVVFTHEGMEFPVIHADTEQEQVQKVVQDQRDKPQTWIT